MEAINLVLTYVKLQCHELRATYQVNRNVVPFIEPYEILEPVITEADAYSDQNGQGDPGARMLTRALAKELSATSAQECLFVGFLTEEEPKEVSEVLKHPGWVDAIQEELNQFARNNVWTLVPSTYRKTIIGFKWIFKNKMDETDIVIKNKARLVAQG
ncbi:hypothetical protein Tco_0521742 [Tanacetum coccineum]